MRSLARSACAAALACSAAAGLGVLGVGDQALVVPSGASMQVGNSVPDLCVGLGVVQLQRPYLIGRDHWDAGMDVAEQLRLCSGVDPVAELRHPLMQALPEHQPLGDRWRRIDRAEHGDMLVADLAAGPMGLDQAGLQAGFGLAKADEHVVAR